jgi:hypothetical protein
VRTSAALGMGAAVLLGAAGEAGGRKRRCLKSPCRPLGLTALNEPAARSCDDLQKNGYETDTDCGGPTCAAKCAGGAGCAAGRDCASGVCAGGKCAAPTCSDGVRNGGETGTDCGGPGCTAKCAEGAGCAEGRRDCASGMCAGGACAAPTCEDGLKNGDETDVDCGGGFCPQCRGQRACWRDSDCKSESCVFE